MAVPAEKTRVLWSKFAAYEAQFGDLGSLLRVEKRRAEAFPGDAHTMAGLVNVAERYSYLDLKVVSDRELGIAALEKLEKSMPASRGKSRGSTAVEGKAKEGTLDDKVGKNPLESFHPERYPRPDFGRYAVHKMDASSSAASLPPRPKVEDRLPPSGSTSLPSIPTPSHFAGGRTPTVGISGARSPLGPVPGSTAPGPGMIPELIARLISYLPPAHQYAGPRLPVDDLLAYLNSLPIPPPTQPPIYVPMPVVGAMPTVMSPQGPGYVSPNPYTGAWGAVGAVPKRRNEEDDRGRKRFRG